MNFGSNTNVRVGDVTYHVQTEDRGPSHPFVDTVVYEGGRVVYKRSTAYEEFTRTLAGDAAAQYLRERLSDQHREVIAELQAGTLALASGSAPAGLEPSIMEVVRTLDLRLLNPAGWLTPSGAAFEVELLDKASNSPVVDAEVEAVLQIEHNRVPCAEGRTDAQGRTTLKFPMPPVAADGAAFLIRAADGARYGELMLRLKAKRAGSRTPASK